ncbi:hypothetical protein Scep_025764 [Stephania cephalantha]|uniref:Zinc-ribbon domain-containing protein n=1 Tax=Stephania cephalantha TaxID=152367 RepID=A0AAP0ELC8_9MAGN
MAEGSKVRLVRCPKCENLLPELPDFPVYQCGGCGAVLQVKNKSVSSDGSLEKSNEEMVRSGSEKFESDREVERLEIRGRRGRGEISNTSGASHRIEDIEGSAADDMSLKTDGTVVEEEENGVSGANYRRPCKVPVENWSNGDNHDVNSGQGDLGRVNLEKEIGEVEPPVGVEVGDGRRTSQQISNWLTRDRVAMGASYRRNPRAVMEGGRFSTSHYPDEGPSNHLRQGPSGYGYVDPMKDLNNLDGLSRVESLEQDRAELLKKLEELKDQLSRSSDLGDKSKERVPVDGRAVPPDPYGSGRDAWLPERSYASNGASLHPSTASTQVRRPLYFNHSHEPVPLMSRHDMNVHNFYPPMHLENDITGYGDMFGPPMGRAPNPPPLHQYAQQQHQPRDFYYRQFIDSQTDFAGYPHNTFFHQPACSCVHCFEKRWQAPAQVPQAIFHNRRFPDVPPNPMFFRTENPGSFGPQSHNPGVVNAPPLHPHEPLQPRMRRPSVIDGEMGGFVWGATQRAAVGKRNGRCFRPMAGGAPFVACCNCFESLQLPKKISLSGKNCQKMRCGACSTVISILFDEKKLVVSATTNTKKTSQEVSNGFSEVAEGSVSHPRGRENRISVNSLSDDYDHSGYYFQALDAELLVDQRMNSSESQKMHAALSSSSCVSEDEESPERTVTEREESNSEELNPRSNTTPPLPGSPLRDHFDYSTIQQLASKFGKGNRSKRTEKDDAAVTKSTSRQNSLKDVPVATEMEVSFNEFSNGGMSQDSGEANKDDNRPNLNKGSESFFAGLIKKSFKDFSKSNQSAEDGKSSVSINGHPITERSLKKAEKLAGPVRPGQYWYDYQAGFWGLMGQPCLGIVPPFIEEFNYPLPKDCASGNTGVLVNGRELHQKDLDLLASRGLSTTRDRSYSVEISGKVYDSDTGEELDCLGKLAPTVERVGHGFGMRAPKVNT